MKRDVGSRAIQWGRRRSLHCVSIVYTAMFVSEGSVQVVVIDVGLSVVAKGIYPLSSLQYGQRNYAHYVKSI
jgi:hypothetical protein